MTDNHEADRDQAATPDKQTPEKRHHRIANPWIRIPLKTIGWVLCVLVALVIIIPVLLYVPPVQTFVKNVACRVVHDKTGMDVDIERFRLKFPLDISLQGVKVIEASGDTMVNAKEAIADVKLMPLLHLDVQVQKLRLLDGYYRMVSADSSMIMKIRAGLLNVAPGASANIAKSEIILEDALLRDGDVSLYMDVWKKKPTPADSVQPAPGFLIKTKNLKVENIKFGMSMLPTIDTLQIAARDLNLQNAVIDLRNNDITADNLVLASGNFKYITPTAEYIAAHPAPIDTISPPSPPMKIQAKKISLRDFGGVYAVKGARPQPGFDASYVQVSNVGIALSDFYNEASTLRLPIDSLTASERCGLKITSGSGVFSLDSIGINLKNLKIQTPYSNIAATADIPFALMQMEPNAPLSANAQLRLGIPDLVAFMPSLKTYTKYFRAQTPLIADVDASGTLSSVAISRLNASMPGIFAVKAHGFADNALDFKRMHAAIDIDGSVTNPSPIDRLTGGLGFELPPLHLKGKAGVDRQTYTADLALTTPKGNLAAQGSVALTAERYDVVASVRDIDVAHFVPDLGVGRVSLDLHAHGAGFNPTITNANTAVNLNVASITYKGKTLNNVLLNAVLADGQYSITGASPNPDLDFNIDLSGHIAPDDYSAHGYVHLHHADLQAFGLSDDVCRGTAVFTIDGTASPDRWLYNADLNIDRLEWSLPDMEINLPEGVQARIDAQENSVICIVESDKTSLDFASSQGLKAVIDRFSDAAAEITAQIDKKELEMERLQHLLPPFHLSVNAAGSGLLSQFLAPSGIAIDTVAAYFDNDSLFHGNASLLALNTTGFQADTLSLNLSQRGKLLDYKAHMGNRPGTLDEFAHVDLNGYVGANRLSAYLRQRNLADETGYRLGLTAALMDSTVSLHFTPLSATIAYMPWTFNDDNFIDVSMEDYAVEANLRAESRESSILLLTEPSDRGGNDLHLNLTNIHIQDFLQMSLTAPPVAATVNSDLRIHYADHELDGSGTLDILGLNYDRTQVGDFNLTLNAGYNFQGDSQIVLGMKVNDRPDALNLTTTLGNDEKGFDVKDVKLNLNSFPLSVANAFLGADVASLSGVLNGEMDMSGGFSNPLLNGDLAFSQAKVYVPMIGSDLRLDSVPLTVADNVVRFNQFDIWGQNSNPLTIDGSVDARDFSDMNFDVKFNARNFQPVGNDQRARSDIYGKLFLDLDGAVKGPMQHFDINATANILSATDITYTVPETAAATVSGGMDGVVTFVNLADTVQVAKTDIEQQTMAMRISAALTINPGAMVTVNLPGGSTNKAQISPSGTLNYSQNFMGDMRLTGQLYTGNGFVSYSIPVMGQKTFNFDPQSFVLFNGDVMNPSFNIKAYDPVKANVVQTSGNTNVVDFLVTLTVTGNLIQPNLQFDLSADNDVSVQNELQSMSADQRQQQAMNLLITGNYTGMGTKTANGSLVSTGTVYSLLASQINSWAAKNIRGIDLSFGVDQYDTKENGESSTTTSYSYQLSKSLFNNRFKISVGGNYATDADADENFTQNLISDISFEYMLKQTATTSMYVRLFRHNDFESILEGDVTEMGAGFVLKRRLSSLRGLFRVNGKKHKEDAPADSVAASEKADTLMNKKGGQK